MQQRFLLALTFFAASLGGCRPDGLVWRPWPSPAEPPAAVHPLRVSENGRHLVDSRGVPFFLVGDAAWSIITALTKAEAEQYLDERRRRGFNTILVNLIEHKFNGPRNREGHLPFTTPGDFATPNPAYFDHAGWVLKKAGEKGFLVLVAPCYLGYAGTDEGWFDEVLANGVDKSRAYARYVADRYRSLDNLIWVLGGDREPGPALPHVQAMAEEFQRHDERHLRTAHLAPEISTRDIFVRDAWVDFNLTYTYGLVHAMVLRDYYRTPVMPTVMIESYYEGEHGSKPDWIRRQAYGAILNGAAGQVMGNRPVWLFDPGWRKALDSPGAESIRHLRNLFLSLPWHVLVPDFSLVASGQGNPYGQHFVSAARSPDGRLALIYIPSQRYVTIDTTVMMEPRIPAWWFDPRSGRVAAIGALPRGQRTKLRPPFRGDWILGLGRIPS